MPVGRSVRYFGHLCRHRYRHFFATFSYKERQTFPLSFQGFGMTEILPVLPPKNVTPLPQFKRLYKSVSRQNPHFGSVKNCINGIYLIKKT